MATTTTNFGWDIPQSTDLVKDGATAIAALGQDIDTALVDLKGGTTGQVLAKASGTDLDFSWVAQDDSNAIQNAIVDAKGDLISATANDTPARLAVGANDTVLTADSTTATGLKWAAPAASSGPAFAVYRNTSAQSISGSTWTKAQLQTEEFDTAGNYDPTTNYRFTPTTAGYYQINLTLSIYPSSRAMCAIYKNGTSYKLFSDQIASADQIAGGGGAVVYMNGTTDYIEAYGWSIGASNIYFGLDTSFMSGVWIRS